MPGRKVGWVAPRGRAVALRRRRAGERGLTLIELLVTFAVMAVGVVGIASGLDASVFASVTAQSQAQLEVAMREVSDYVTSDQLAYVQCPQPAQASYQSSVSALSLPTGITATVNDVWVSTERDGVTLAPNCTTKGSGSDLGVQEIQVTVATTARSLTRAVWKGPT